MNKKSKISETLWFLPQKHLLMSWEDFRKKYGFYSKIKNIRTDKKTGDWKYDMEIMGEPSVIAEIIRRLSKSKNFKIKVRKR